MLFVQAAGFLIIVSVMFSGITTFVIADSPIVIANQTLEDEIITSISDSDYEYASTPTDSKRGVALASGDFPSGLAKFIGLTFSAVLIPPTLITQLAQCGSQCGDDINVVANMVGFPISQSVTYIKRLIKNGYTVIVLKQHLDNGRILSLSHSLLDVYFPSTLTPINSNSPTNE